MERCVLLNETEVKRRSKNREMCLHIGTPSKSVRLRWRTRLASEQGAEIVEAAVVITVFLTLLIGVFWLARGYNVAETITRAAREGARFAVTPTCATCGNTYPTDAEVQSVINASLLASSVDPAQVQPNPITIQRGVVLNPGETPLERGVVIGFNYPFQFQIPFTSLNMTTILLSTSVQMREE